MECPAGGGIRTLPFRRGVTLPSPPMPTCGGGGFYSPCSKIRTSSGYGTAGLVKYRVFSSCSPLCVARLCRHGSACRRGSAPRRPPPGQTTQPRSPLLHNTKNTEAKYMYSHMGADFFPEGIPPIPVAPVWIAVVSFLPIRFALLYFCPLHFVCYVLYIV